MKLLEFIKTNWDSIVASLAIIISIASFIQAKRLHNDNKKLATVPNLDIELLFDSRIRGRIIQRNDGFDQLNIWESKYTPFYTNHNLYFDDVSKALFTVLIKNVGNGVAKNIKIAEITLFSDGSEISYKANDLLFTCSSGEIKANKIYINHAIERLNKVEVVVMYEDILKETHTLKNTYEPISEQHCELKLLKSIGEKRK